MTLRLRRAMSRRTMLVKRSAFVILLPFGVVLGICSDGTSPPELERRALIHQEGVEELVEVFRDFSKNSHVHSP